MSGCDDKRHDAHDHQHGPDCGHPQVRHGDHVDFLHDGHLHHQHGDHVDEHTIDLSPVNPAGCRPLPGGDAETPRHVHGPDCGHPPVPHGDHVDFLVDGRLHHPHEGHCDDHGPVEIVKR